MQNLKYLGLSTLLTLSLTACNSGQSISQNVNLATGESNNSSGQSTPPPTSNTTPTQPISSTKPNSNTGQCNFGEILGFQDVDFAEDLVVSNKHAYVFAKSKGIFVFDVSDPKALKALKKIDVPSGGEAWDGAVSGNILAVAFRKAGVYLYDISDPSTPQALGIAKVDSLSVNGVALDGKNLVATGGTGSNGMIAHFDISNPKEPQLLGKADIKGQNTSGSSVALKGSIAYYGQAQGSLRVFDLSEGIGEVTHIDHPGTPGHEGWALGLTIKENTLYLSNWGAGWISYDISQPQSPKALNTFSEKFAAYDSDIVGDRLYGAAPEGLYILDISNPSAPRLVGDKPLNIKAPKEFDDGAHGIQVVDGVAFVADNKQQGLVSVCVSE